MRKSEFILLWILHLLALVLLQSEPFLCLLTSAVLLTFYLIRKRLRYSRVKGEHKSIQYYNVSNQKLKKYKDIVLVFLTGCTLVLSVVVNINIYGIAAFTLLFITPVMPGIFQWVANVSYSDLAYGLLIGDDYIQMGFDGVRYKFEDFKGCAIKGETVEFKLHNSSKVLAFEFTNSDISEIKHLLSHNLEFFDTHN